jgi:hypothetical protein
MDRRMEIRQEIEDEAKTIGISAVEAMEFAKLVAA